MKRALAAWLTRAAGGGDRHACAIAAAEAVRDRPWDVVHQAGLLARCKVTVAETDLGLTADLREVRPDAPGVIVRIEPGQPYPRLDHRGRKRRGAFDTPVDMARRVVWSALNACDGPARVGLDPACGTGAFLVAMLEAGVEEVYGSDIDPTALAVANIAAPEARLVLEDAIKHGPTVDLVCGNPPFVPPERQDKAMRAELRRRFPWLHGRFDLVIPFAASAVARVREGGGVGLVLPAAALVQPYGAVLRRRWVTRHRFVDVSGPHPFPGAQVDVMLLVLQVGAGPAPLPVYGMPPDQLLRLDNVPIDPDLMPGDVVLVEQIRSQSVPLGTLAVVDTGLVAHGPGGGKQRLLYDAPGEGRVPYADAREFFAGKRVWLRYAPKEMHRPKHPDLFERPKIVIQRIRGRAPVRAAIDWDGVYVGHTCTVVQPQDDRVPIDCLLELIRSPLVDALTRIERGQRLDLYPRDVAAFPVPTSWLRGGDPPADPADLARAYGLSRDQVARLRTLAGR